MSTLTIRDLAHSSELDHAGMCAVRGGVYSAPSGPFANVDLNFAVDLDISLLQYTELNFLNNIGVIGAPLSLSGLKVAPTQRLNVEL